MKKRSLFILLSIILLGLSSSRKPNTVLGMDYYIKTNKKSSCKGEFPSGLSSFFEAFGGYAEYSEVAQMEKVLGIDLSIYQKTYMPEDVWLDLQEIGEVKDGIAEHKTHKQETMISLNNIERITKNLFQKVKADPSFYKKLKYKNENKKGTELYPTNNDIYYSSGEFLKELEVLLNLYDCYKKDGVTHIWLEYM